MFADRGIAHSNTANEYARQENLAALNAHAAQRERHTVYDTSLNPLRKTAQEHSVKVASLNREIADLIDQRDGLTIRIAEVCAVRDRERELYEEASRELSEKLGGVA